MRKVVKVLNTVEKVFKMSLRVIIKMKKYKDLLNIVFHCN